MSDVARILTNIEQGDCTAAERLLPLVYDELRRMASAMLANERPGQTLQPTALVHEAWLRLAGSGKEQSFASRTHFFAAAAESMRRILVDQARRKASVKHGGQINRQDLLDSDIATAAPPNEVIAVHEALDLTE
jgi:RNA polymerase sigma factor (TIGR02999 family)